VNQGLQAALDVHRGCGRVDPPGGYKEENGKQPKKHHEENKPSNQRSKKTLATRGFDGCVWKCSHNSG
jgi:hypothetical protein